MVPTVRHYTLALGLGLWSGAAFAAGPYIVDDASILEPDRFQNESWLSRTNKGETLAVVNLSHRIMGSEVMIQETHDDRSGNGSDSISPQIKYRWREGDDAGRVASSLIVGGSYSNDAGRVTSLYAYVPTTLSLTTALDVNVNAGWQYSEDRSRHAVTWGVGTEYHFDPAVSLVDEIFGVDSKRPGFQLGPRVKLTNWAQFDAVYGYNVLGTSEQLGTVGMTFNF